MTATDTTRPAPARSAAERRARLFTRINRLDGWFKVLGLSFVTPALRALAGIVTDDLIVSVPREPLWRALNMARGKYLTDLGNTPGHLNHWSRRGIVSLIGCYFDIIEVRSPLPWTMIHCRRRRQT